MIDETPYLLLADDDPDTLAMLKAAVTQQGWRCETADTPQKIVDCVRQHMRPDGSSEFDLLITDINYRYDPEREGGDGAKRTGVKAVREIRRELCSNLPVIFITAWDTSMLRKEALTVGQELIAKPFSVEYLMDRVKIWIDWAMPPRYEGQDRRRYGINRSGHYRRNSDHREEQQIVPNEYPRALEQEIVKRKQA